MADVSELHRTQTRPVFAQAYALDDGYNLNMLRKAGWYTVVSPGMGPSSGTYFVEVMDAVIQGIYTVKQAATDIETGEEWVRNYVRFTGWSTWAQRGTGGGGGGATDLSVNTITATTLNVASSTGNDATIPAATVTDAGLMTAAMKAKLDGIEAGADNNVGTDLSMANRGVDTLDIESSTGNDITVPKATPSLTGLMSAADKTKLDTVTSGANVNVTTDLSIANKTANTLDIASSDGTDATIPKATATDAGLMSAADKVVLDAIVSNVTTDLSIANRGVDTLDINSSDGADITVPKATTSLTGLMSAADKTKLDGIATGAQVNVATDLSVANKTGTTLDVASSTGNDATIPAATATDAGLMTAADQVKLAGIAAGAQVNVATDLSMSNRGVDTLDVNSSTGTDITLPKATSSLTGLQSAADKTKLDGIATGAQVNVATDLSVGVKTSTTFDVISSTGNDATLPAASSTEAGLMIAADKAKLDKLDAKGADIASATTTDLDAATGEYVHVTGTSTISTITLSDGIQRIVRFTGALQLTHGSNLVLPGSTNITTVAGDIAIFVGGGSSVTRCVGYFRATGKALVETTQAGTTNLSIAASGATTLDIASDTGTDATIPAATASAAGLMIAADKAKSNKMHVRGADISSSSTTDLDAATGEVVNITGTTNISAITLADGVMRFVKFAGILTIANGANLVLPGGTSIVTAANDMAIFIGVGSSVVRCLTYVRASGLAVTETATNLTIANRGTDTLDINSSTGADITVPVATASLTGLMNSVDKAKVDKLFVRSTDVASATTPNLDTCTGEFVDITGTTPITSFTLASGVLRFIRFTGILTFTHGSNLLLPGAANITTAAGDWAIVVGFGGGVTRCIAYQKVSGRPVVDSPTNLSIANSGATTLDVASDTGTDATIPAATASIAGLMTAADFAAILRNNASSLITAGHTFTSFSAGTKSTGTFTPAASNGPVQHAVNGGAHTLAPPAADSSIIIQYTNNGSAGAITTSGFTKVTGTTPTTVNGDDFLAYITRVNGFTFLRWEALQ